MRDRLGPAVVGLVDRVERQPDAVREQRLAAVGVEAGEERPELPRLRRHLRLPARVARLDGARRDGVGEARRLGGEQRAFRLNLQAGVEAVAVEQPQAERMQRGQEGRLRIGGERIAQREGAVRGELGQQPVGQRADALVLLRRLGGRSGCAGVGLGRGLALRLRIGLGLVGLDLLLLRLGRDRRFVLRPDIAALDAQRARAVNADEDAGARHLLGIVGDGPVLECGERLLDLGQAAIGLLRHLIGLGAFLLQPVELGLECLAPRRLLLGRRLRLAGQAAQAVVVAVGEVGRGLDPVPTLRTDRLGFALQPLAREPVEQPGVLPPAAIVGLEQVA